MNFAFRPHPVPTAGMVVLVAILLSLGTWQMSRFFEKSEAEATWSERRTADPIAIRSLDDLDVTTMEHRKVEVFGEIDPERIAIFQHQRWAGQPGCWLASPLELSGGGTLLAVRGFVPIQRTGRCELEDAGFEPSATWTALVHAPDLPFVDTRAREREEPPVTTWASFDVDGAYEVFGIEDRPTEPAVVVLDERHSATPYPAASFEHVTDAYLTSMRHLNYAGTWFILVFVVLGVWGWISMDRLPDDA